MSRKYLAALAVVVGGATVLLVLANRPTPYRFHYENILGTSMDVTVVARSASVADTAKAAVLDRIARDAKVLSGYEPDSEFSRWFATLNQPVKVSPELFEVLGLFDRWRTQSGGALDAASEAISVVWRRDVAAGRVPTAEELASTVADVQTAHWTLDPATRTATHLDRTPLILNSFTKSYIIDRAATAALHSTSARAVVVNIGGDLVVRGDWSEPVAVTNPMDDAENAVPLTRLAVHDRAVATSGSYRRGFDLAGRHYSHIVDPRTGQSMSAVASATVVADRAADAGALATAFCVLTPDESRQLAATVPGAEYLIVLADGRSVTSAGWHTLAAKPASAAVANPVAELFASEQTSASDYELTVAVDIAQQSGRAERPYLAVWIEDKDKFPVRTLTVLYREARYLPELRAWYRDDRLRAMAEGTEIIGSVSSATRSPGHYTFKWDMKDQQGRLVKPGPYTVCIEAAREHGTYQLMRQPLDLSGAAKQETVPTNGGVEISAASLDYHKIK